MAVYNFRFPAAAAGLGVSIEDAAGEEVDTATAGAADGVQGAVIVTADLPVGSYTAEASLASEFRSYRAAGVLDIPASLSFGGLDGEVSGAEGVNLQEILEDIVARLALLEP